MLNAESVGPVPWRQIYPSRPYGTKQKAEFVERKSSLTPG